MIAAAGRSLFRKDFFVSKTYMSKTLPVPQRVPLGRKDIILNIHPESDEKINDNGRAHGQKRDVDKVLPDGSGSHPHFVTNIGAHAEYMPFYELPESLHGR